MTIDRNPRIDERLNPQFIRLCLLGLAFQALLGALFAFTWDTQSPLMQKLTIGVLAVGISSLLAVLIRLLFCRVRIDENGVSANGLLSGFNTLRWEEIRTAAVYRLNLDGSPTNAVILLTTLPAEEALTRQALTGGKVLSPHDSLRIPLGYDRLRAIEHYLHMTLPTYHF